MPPRLALVLAAVLLSLGAVSATVIASEPTNDPDDAISADGLEPVSNEADATPIEPDPTVTDPHPHAWEQIVVGADGVTLSIYFSMGVEDCDGLHSVDISPTDGGIDVRLQTGVPAGAEDLLCIAIAQQYVTTVTLDAPLIGNAT